MVMVCHLQPSRAGRMLLRFGASLCTRQHLPHHHQPRRLVGGIRTVRKCHLSLASSSFAGNLALEMENRAIKLATLAIGRGAGKACLSRGKTLINERN